MPRIEYTLSFENYLEMTSSRRVKKDFRLAVASAITGFFCIAAGYLFLRLRQESFFPGGWLLASGLLLTFLGMILGMLARPKSSRPDLKTLRREYELGHSDKRALEFDENGWRVFWYEGEDVRPWSCLRQVYDMDKLLVLTTETTHYWLPKDALQRDGRLEPLKTLAEHALTQARPLFEVALRPSARVYATTRMFHTWRRYLPGKILCLTALTLITYWLLGGIDELPRGIFGLLAGVPLLLILCEFLFFRTKYFMQDWTKSSANAEIMSDRIGYRAKMVRWIIEHRQLLEIREIPGAFLLYYEASVYYLVPKASFAPGQIAQFKEVVKNNQLIPGDR